MELEAVRSELETQRLRHNEKQREQVYYVRLLYLLHYLCKASCSSSVAYEKQREPGEDDCAKKIIKNPTKCGHMCPCYCIGVLIGVVN